MAPSFLTSTLDGGKWSASCPGHFTSWEMSRYPLDRSLSGSHSRGEEKKCYPYRESNPGRPARTSSLYWLSYPDSYQYIYIYIYIPYNLYLSYWTRPNPPRSLLVDIRSKNVYSTDAWRWRQTQPLKVSLSSWLRVAGILDLIPRTPVGNQNWD
jgi:hypothetical protein